MVAWSSTTLAWFVPVAAVGSGNGRTPATGRRPELARRAASDPDGVTGLPLSDGARFAAHAAAACAASVTAAGEHVH
jgi:hypothetical protein